MLRLRLPLAAFAAMIFAAPLSAQAARLNGDVTNDGAVTAADAQAVLIAVVDIALPAAYDKTYGDADCDGKLTTRDAQIILSSVVQLDVSAFCVGKPAGGGVATVTVDYGTGNVLVGGELQLTATPRDETNKEITGRTVAWSTSDAAKATVSSAGVVKGVAVGNVTITATVDGKSGTAPITVSAAGGTTTFTVSPATVTVLKDSTVQLSAVINDAAGNPVSGKTIAWATSDAAKATVSATGLVKGIALGSVTITASTAGLPNATATVSIVSLAATANRTWTGAVSTDWSVAGNWTPSGVPISTDTISVPAAPVNQPVLGVNGQTVAGIVVATGAKLTIGANELQVTGRVDVDGEVIGTTGKLTIQGLNQSTSYVRGKLPSVGVAGKTVIVGATTITGSLEQVAGSVIDLNGFTVKVSKDLSVRGTLLQAVATSVLDVRGNARFFTDQSTTATQLTAGTLRVGGHFAVVVPTSATNPASPFPASGTHRTILDGGAKQQVADTGLATVAFQELLVQNTAGGVEFTAPAATVTTQRFLVNGRLTGSTATSISGPARVVVLSHVTSATGGSVTLRNLSVGGVLSAGSDFKPDTVTFIGVNQVVPSGQAYQYQNMVAAGDSKLNGSTTVAGGLVIGCVTSMAGCTQGGALDVAGKKLFVAKNLQQADVNGGVLYMKTTTDSVVVTGGVLGRLAAPDTSEFNVTAGSWLHGWLHVAGDLRVRGTGPGGVSGATHVVTLNGPLQQKLAVKNGFTFQYLTIADSVGVVMDDNLAARARIVSVAADLNINTASKLTGTGRMEVAGNVQTTTGSSIEISTMSVGSILRASGGFTPDTAEFVSPTVVQTIQNLPAYKNVVVKGKAIFGGSMTFSGSLFVASGAELNVESRHVQVTKRLTVNGILRMQDGRDTLTVLGDSAIFSGTIDNVKAFATAGLLRVAGSIRMDSAAFYPTGSHRVQLIGSANRGVRGGFQDLELAGTGSDTLKNVIVRGALSGTVASTLVMDTVRVDGNASFAEAATVTVKPAATTTTVNANVKGDLTAAKALTLTVNGRLQVDGKLEVGGALTASGGTASLLTVGNLTFGSGSAITVPKLNARGTISSATGFTPDTLIMYGTGALPASTYKRLVISGNVTLGGNVTANSAAVSCTTPLGFTATCNTAATAPTLTLNGKKMTVTGGLDQSGKIVMGNAADTLSVRSTFAITKVWARTYTAGVLLLGGDLRSSQATTASDTAVSFAGRSADGTYTKGTKLVFDAAAGTQNLVAGDATLIVSDVDVAGGSTVNVGQSGSALTTLRIIGSLSAGKLSPGNGGVTATVDGDITLRDGAFLQLGTIYKGGYSETGTITGAAARHAKIKTIRWVTQPTNRTAGQAFSPELQVEALDSADVRLNAQVPITININGVTRAVTVNGLATFTGLAPKTVFTNAPITATAYVPGGATGSVQVNSNTITVSNAGGTHVRLAEQPKYFAYAGSNLVNVSSGSLVARITDAYGNQTFSGTNSVTLTTVSSPDTLYGTKTLTMASGSASFSAGVQARKAGVYKIAPAVAGLTSVETDTFRIAHATPAKVTVTRQPTDAKSGAVIAAGPQLTLFDAYDNLADGTGQLPSTPTVAVSFTRVSGTGTTTPTQSFVPVFNKGVLTLENFNVGGVTSTTVYTVTFTIVNYGSISTTSAQITITP